MSDNVLRMELVPSRVGLKSAVSGDGAGDGWNKAANMPMMGM